MKNRFWNLVCVFEVLFSAFILYFAIPMIYHGWTDDHLDYYVCGSFSAGFCILICTIAIRHFQTLQRLQNIMTKLRSTGAGHKG